MPVLQHNPALWKTAAAGGGGADPAYKIERSLRLEEDDTAELIKKQGIGNTRTWTLSWWLKRSGTLINQWIFSAYKGGGGNYVNIGFYDNDLYVFVGGNPDASSYNYGSLISTAEYRDYTGWMHYCVSFDSQEFLVADRMKAWINGKQVTSYTGQDTPKHLYTYWNSTYDQEIGSSGGDNDQWCSLYVADAYNIDGLALYPSAFGEFDDSQCWQPKAFKRPAPNQDITWSSALSCAAGFDGSGTAAGSPTKAFTGQVGLGVNGIFTYSAANTRSEANAIVFTPSGGLEIKQSLEFWAGRNATTETVQVELDMGNGYGERITSTSGKWITLFEGKGTLTKFKTWATAGNGGENEFGSIKVDGVILQDSLTDISVRNNPNNGIEWSTYGTTTNFANPGNAFDGKILYGSETHTDTTMSSGTANSTWTWDLGTKKITGVETIHLNIYASSNQSGSNLVKINGTDVTSKILDIGHSKWLWVQIDDFTEFEKLEIANNYWYLSGIAINGQPLIDNSYDNSFHLKFDDVTSDHNLGKDTLASKVTTATGGLPIYNTNDTGEKKESGYRDDSSAGSTDGTGLVLAIPGDALTDEHDHINAGSSVKTINNTNCTLSTTTSRLYGTSIHFNGTNAKLTTTTDSSDFDISGGTFTFECWFMPGESTSTSKTIITTKETGGGSGALELGINQNYLFCYTGSTQIMSTSNSADIQLKTDQWHHLAVTRDGTTWRWFIDGELLYENATGVSGSTDGCFFGYASTAGGTPSDRYIKANYNDIRFYKGTAKYTTNFKPPTRNDFTPANLVAATSVTDTTTDTIKNWRCYKNYSGTANYAVNYKIQWSNDNSTWTDAVSGNLASGSAGCGWVVGDTSYTGSQTAKYWKLKVLDITSNHAPRATKIDLQKADNSWVNVQTWNSGNEDCDDSGQYTWHNTDYTWTGGGSYSEVTSKDVDSVTDSPTNYGTDTGAGGEVRGNYCVMNPLDSHPDVDLIQGNLYFKREGAWKHGRGTFGMSTGKWYFEAESIDPSGTPHGVVGIANKDANFTETYSGGGNPGIHAAYVNATSTGGMNMDGSWTGSLNFTAGNYIGVAVDMDSSPKTVRFYRNGVIDSQATTIDFDGPFFPWVGAHSTGWILNFGQKPYKYQNAGTNRPSTDYKALCTQNLPDTFSGAAADTVNNPSKFFDVLTYTGDGNSSGTARKGLNFTPDVVWIKGRNVEYNHHLHDRLISSGANGGAIFPNLDGTVDYGQGAGLNSFDAGGFTVKQSVNVNQDTKTYLAWCWDLGDAASGANDAGSIDIASGGQWKNTTAGMSITKWTGTNANATIGHGLTGPPEFMLIKRLDNAGDWAVYHKDLGNTGRLKLNTSDGTSTHATFWQNTSPDDDVFSVGTSGDVNGHTDEALCYAWTSIPGYSAFGKYTGTDVDPGPFVYCGFRPRFIIIKTLGTQGSSSWILHDTERSPYNPSGQEVQTNNDDVEYAYTRFDILANGWKTRTAEDATNYTADYVWAAWAEHPFKTARAR